MARAEHYQILIGGAAAWNSWRDENPEMRPILTWAELNDHNLLDANLVEAQFSGASLRESILDNANAQKADFSGASLEYACFDGANLREASFRGAKLQGASFKHADLSHCDFRGADLTDVDFSGANVKCANLSCAILNNITCEGSGFSGAIFTQAQMFDSHIVKADFSEAWFDETEMSQVAFIKCNLSDSFRLETVVHSEPSTICVDTLFKAFGGIPSVFLIQMGIPEQYVEALSSVIALEAEEIAVEENIVGDANEAGHLLEPGIASGSTNGRNELTAVDSSAVRIEEAFAKGEGLLSNGAARASPEVHC
jgi:uncharacterized protein YjbI with pentapeptide repeats